MTDDDQGKWMTPAEWLANIRESVDDALHRRGLDHLRAAIDAVDRFGEGSREHQLVRFAEKLKRLEWQLGQEDARTQRLMDAAFLAGADFGELQRDGIINASQAYIASLPRPNRGSGLKVRALARALRDDPSLRPATLCSRLETGAWTLEDDPDDDDIELSLDAYGVRVRDLRTDETDTIPADQLRTYMSKAKSRNT